jgi:hypothetical protein
MCLIARAFYNWFHEPCTKARPGNHSSILVELADSNSGARPSDGMDE